MLERKKTDEVKLFIVAPCYNEEEALPSSSRQLLEKLEELKKENLIGAGSRIVFVDDGSKDRTWEIIEQLHKENKAFCGLSLAHNRGHQNALLAGLMFAREHADICISIDADLQQDINAMELFLQKYYEGCEIVYGVRNSRNTDSAFKKGTAGLFYKGMKLLGCDLYANSADYRLMSKKALEALGEYGEVNLFLRGIIPDIGMKTGVVHFEVFPRAFGESKYTFKKMMKLAVDGITSFSIRPIHLICMIGMVFLLISAVMIIQCIVDYCMGNTVVGYPTMVCAIWFIGGVQMFSIGIVGEYVGRSYEEVKKRPRYFLQDIYYEEED